MNNELVFIVGLPRTGSTLLRSLLNRSERICISGETHYLHHWAQLGRKRQLARFGDLRDSANLEAFVDYVYLEHASREGAFWPWLNRNVPKGEFQQRLAATDRSDRAIFTLLIELFAEKKRGAVNPEMILGEKTPGNLDYVPVLMDWYPQAKIIHTFRDPRAIYVSAVKLAKASKWGWKNKLRLVPGRWLPPAIETSMAIYILRAWLTAGRQHAVYSRQYPGRYCLVRFEDLIQDPQTQLLNLCNFLAVPYQPEMLDDVAVIESSYNAQRIVRDGIDKKAADRWRGHIPPLIRTAFTTLGRRQLATFGYHL